MDDDKIKCVIREKKKDTSNLIIAKKVNSEIFLDYTKKVHPKFGKVLTFLDNASYHKSRAAKEGPEKFGKGVILEYLLPYAPETNPSDARVHKSYVFYRGR